MKFEFQTLPVFVFQFNPPSPGSLRLGGKNHDHGPPVPPVSLRNTAAPHVSRGAAPRHVHQGVEPTTASLPAALIPPPLPRCSPTKRRFRRDPDPNLSGGWMEFSAMKRRELLELCRQHGLATRGSKADLAASLAGAISVRPSKPSLLTLV